MRVNVATVDGMARLTLPHTDLTQTTNNGSAGSSDEKDSAREYSDEHLSGKLVAQLTHSMQSSVSGSEPSRDVHQILQRSGVVL